MRLKNIFKKSFLLAVLTLGLFPLTAQAETRARQFQLQGGFGVFVGTDGLDAAFDISLEPEFFFSEHASLSLRLDGGIGGVDTFHIGPRFRYYFDIPSAPKFNIFVGAGIGYVANFDGADFGDVALPVFGFQYDLTEHFKIGSDFSFDIVFNGNDVGFAARLLPLVLKWAF